MTNQQDIGSAIPGLVGRPSQHTSRLLQLPFNIQYHICRLVVGRPNHTRTKPVPSMVKDTHGKVPRLPALLRTCSLLRCLGRYIYFTSNSFVIKTVPRFESQCPFKKWTSIVAAFRACDVSHVRISLYEAGRVYVHLIVKPERRTWPAGEVIVEWPTVADSSTMRTVFTSILAGKYPEAVPSGAGSILGSCKIRTKNVVEVVETIFKLSRQAAGVRGPGHGPLTLTDALFRGYHSGELP